jgi:NTP pyrophosphatase (non-canonical NTP hydrolase)
MTETVTRFKQYQDLAVLTSGVHESQEAAILNWTLGLAGESGEFANIVKKMLYHGHDFDLQELKAELGDIVWYVSALCTTLGLNLEDVASFNIAKLARRYPEGFSQERSINRED